MNIMRDTNMHQHVLQAARDAFSEKGYRVSMDEIADRAGVSKQTLYNHFPGKQQLFLEVVRESAAVLASTLTNSELNLREALVRWGESYRQQAFAPQGLAMHRLLVAEAPRIPELAREVFIAGPAVAHAHLVQVLSAAEARGELSMPDAAFAADMLISMLAGFERVRRLFGVVPSNVPPSGRVEWIVDAFLSGFGWVGECQSERAQ